MKHLYILVIVGALAVFGATQLQTGHADQPREYPHAAVFLSATDGEDPGSLIVYQYSASPNSPRIQLYSELGAVLAHLLDNGFKITQTGPGISYTLTR